MNVSETMIANGNLELAIQNMSQSLRMAENLEDHFHYPFIDKAVVLSWIAFTHLQRDEITEALEFSERCIQHAALCGIHTYTNMYITRAYALLFSGDLAGADAIRQQLLQRAGSDPVDSHPSAIHIYGMDLFFSIQIKDKKSLIEKLAVYEACFRNTADYANLPSILHYICALLYTFGSRSMHLDTNSSLSEACCCNRSMKI
jgi:hypothetical protein